MVSGNLHRTLIKNYIVFVLTMLVVSVLALLFLGIALNSAMSREVSPRISANDVVRADYENIDITDIRLMGGWVEILDSENNVIFSKGDKGTAAKKYNNGELYQLLSYEGGDRQFICTAKAFVTGDGLNYTCLVFLPGKNAELQLNLAKSPLPVSRKFFAILFLSLLFFIGIFALNVFIYSKWTAKKISRPLDRITQGIRELRAGNPVTRMDFKAENEFLQIRDAFNNMADRLVASQSEKARLEEARNRLFIDISHDLKTPITIIGGYSKALAENMVKDELQKQRYIETIYNKSLRVSYLIDDLFELAKLENGKSGLNMESADLAEFLRSIAAEHYEQIEGKGLQLELKIPEEYFSYRMDKKELSRVFSNIISNAIEYNFAGTTIKISLFKYENEIVIEIADNGTGIPDAIQESLFDPFVRGDVSRNSTGGTGLGLAIAKKIVENHGGSIKLLTNGEFCKTSFLISLPI